MGVAKSMTLRGGGGGGGPTLSVTMTLIFPKIVWTCPLRYEVTAVTLSVNCNCGYYVMITSCSHTI